MIEHIFVEEGCKTKDKDLVHVRFMTEEQLLASDIKSLLVLKGSLE